MAGQVYPSAPEIPPPATYEKPAGRGRGRGRRGAGCCCCLLTALCSLLVTVLFAAGVTILILWLVLKPVHLPKYALDDVEVRSFSVVGTSLNADIAYNISADNPNRKIGIKYDVINLDTSYAGQALGRSVIPGFYQGHRNVTSIASALAVRNAELGADAAASLSAQVAANSVPLHVRADAKAHVRIGKYTSPGFWVRVDCDVDMAVNPARLLRKSCKLKRRS